ncbi:MAG: hypothetical protein K0Q79_2063 [Flavipsychrobacter sp.]|jgi:hypothetical protein|nr:hypothetical protein [Flavipsychrobacter sp.]
MIRKITLICLLFIGFQSVSRSQVVLDSVSIFQPIGQDTTCPASQLTFWAVQSNDTFTSSRYHWYINSIYTGVFIDTLRTTAPVDGDTVWCNLVYRNSLGIWDSFRSNEIIVRRNDTVMPRVIISLISGSNPDCTGGPLTFAAYPVNGGTAPTYQWLINGLPVPAADSVTFRRSFTAGDTVSVQMIGNSTCSAPFSDTAISSYVVISHDSMTATITIIASFNPICQGTSDTFRATVSNAGAGYTFQWFVNSTYMPTALGPEFITSSLNNTDIVYAKLIAPDPCVINDTTISNVITMTVIPNLNDSAWMVMTGGTNPGCLDSPVTFSGYYMNFGTSPDFDWYVNGVLVSHNTPTYTAFYLDGDIVQFRVRPTDGGCYQDDSIATPAVLMIRDSTPVTPWLSLIGNLLVANSGGTYQWFYNSVNSCTGALLLTGITAETYNPHSPGYYFIKKDTANCVSLCSNVLYISLLEIKDMYKPAAKVYPNPTTGIINLDWEGQVVNRKLDVYTMIGQGLLHQDIENTSHHETDLSYLPAGNYLLVLRDEDGSKTTYKIQITK